MRSSTTGATRGSRPSSSMTGARTCVPPARACAERPPARARDARLAGAGGGRRARGAHPTTGAGLTMAAFEASAPEDRLTRRAERELIAAGCAALRLDPTSEQIERLLGLVDALERGNARFNLTAIRDRPGMLRKHVLDSLTLHDYLSGKPLAVVDPGRRFTLIEATGKKAQYVAATARELGCTNVEVVNERAERYRPFE